jgi:poly(hydroxyalkanoate) depolymerase family esterase
MMKGLTRLWLRSVKQVSKAQRQQNKKLVNSLFGKPSTSKRRGTASPAVKSTAKSATKSSARSASTVSTRSKTKADAGTTAGAGASAAPLPGKWLASYYSSFTEDGRLPARRMSYWLYLPSKGVDATSSLPLVVMLHGCEQTATRFSQGTRMNRLAEQKGFAVLYPQQSLKAHPNRCWPWYEKTTQEGGGEVKLIVGTIRKVLEKYPIDTTRIYVAGLSAGAAMANIIALNYPHLVAAVGLHSGTIFGAGHSRMGAYAVMQGGSVRHIGTAIRDVVNRVEAFPPIPAILIHGQQDKVVRPVNLAQLAQQFKILNGLSDESEAPAVLESEGRAGGRTPVNPYKTYDHYNGGKLLLRVCEIFHLEHAWSGGDCALKFNACAGPDASKMMWDFFARHRRPV